MEERTSVEHPNKEIKETTPVGPTEPLPQKFTPQRQLAKQSIQKCTDKHKESPNTKTQRKNLQ